MSTHHNHNFRPTATNMVATVENIINGYRMGPIRALAQEPVQNSKDAALTRNTLVTVVYELHERTLMDGTVGHMLTVTDTGTKGLGGPILDPVELSAKGSILEPGHDWTAFEGQGYTKRDEDALGSRGQGKAAFLYHSNPPKSQSDAKRMVIVYDTMLHDGEYRFGIRYANPSDVTMSPPLAGNEARRAVASKLFEFDSDLAFPIDLEPLSQPGTRIIIPYLAPTTRDAIVSGELERWLQMIWWRSIQLGDLDIWVKAGTSTSQVQIPDWWTAEPWNDPFDETQMYIKEDIPIPDDSEMRIKRIILACHDRIEEHDPLVSTKEAEFDGVQLLRGGQWIETLGRGEPWNVSKIPSDLRARFRGFVEFDRKLDRELRNARYESPQHDDFKRQTSLVRDIVNQVERCVTEFSEIAGWSEQPDDSPAVEKKHRQVFRQVMEMFTEPLAEGSQSVGGEGKKTRPWKLELNATYPDPTSTRIDWGQSLEDVAATCIATPENAFNTAKVKLIAIGPDHRQTKIDEREVQLDEYGMSTAKFGALPFLKGKGPTGMPFVGCEEPGRYRLQASVEVLKTQTAKASRAVYVQIDPPPPPKNPISVQLLAKNANDPEQRRLKANDDLRVDITVRNRGAEPAKLIIDASLNATEVPGQLVLGDDTPGSVQLLNRRFITIPGIERYGGDATRVSVFDDTIRLLDGLPTSHIPGFYIALAPGAHRVQVDVSDELGNRVASASKTVWFESDPPSPQEGGLPFDIQPISDDHEASGQAEAYWMFGHDRNDGKLILYYSTGHPLYIAATKADAGASRTIPGTRAYLGTICSDALIDWMLEPFIDSRDDSRFEAIDSRRQLDAQWGTLAELMETFRDQCVEGNGIHPAEHGLLRRRIIANMVRLFTEAT